MSTELDPAVLKARIDGQDRMIDIIREDTKENRSAIALLSTRLDAYDAREDERHARLERQLNDGFVSVNKVITTTLSQAAANIPANEARRSSLLFAFASFIVGALAVAVALHSW